MAIAQAAADPSPTAAKMMCGAHASLTQVVLRSRLRSCQTSPCGDDAALLAGELFGNSVQHSGSGAAGGTVTVAVTAGRGVVRVEVTDLSGPGVPQVRPADRDAEGGRGLGLVAGLAARWGWRRRGGRTVTWSGLQAKLH
jgi:anti-sigma regulatory factor (Ser/Thr protein kinase)